jgi:hypothetical protein
VRASSAGLSVAICSRQRRKSRTSASSVARAGGQFVGIGNVIGRAQQRHLVGAGKAEQLFQRLVAKAALGGVEDPLERQVVRRLAHQPQIGQRIADFGAFIEPEPADDAIGQADLDEAVFELARLELRAHQDRHAIERAALALQPLDFLAHAARFLGRVPHPDHAQLVAAVALGPQLLAQALRILGDQARCRAQDMRVER